MDAEEGLPPAPAPAPAPAPTPEPEPEPEPEPLRSESEEDTDDDEAVAAVVIDNGSALIKAGFCDDEAPRSVFENMLGRLRHPGIAVGTGPSAGGESFVGDECRAKIGIVQPRWPIERGVVKRWDAMEEVWRHTFYSELRVDPSEQPVLMTEPPLCPKADREKMAEICLGTFCAPAFYVTTAAELVLRQALLDSGLEGSEGGGSGLVVDSGESVTHIVPISEGYVLPHAVLCIQACGTSSLHAVSEIRIVARLNFDKGMKSLG